MMSNWSAEQENLSRVDDSAKACADADGVARKSLTQPPFAVLKLAQDFTHVPALSKTLEPFIS